MAKRIVGLDFGKDSIRAVEIEDPESARPTIIRAAEIGLPVGAVQSGEVREVHTVAAALKQFWSANGFTTKNVVIGVGSQRVFVREFQVPAMSIQRIRESLAFQVEDMLPVPASDAILDFYPIAESQGENGPVIDGLVIAAIKETVLANISAVKQAGLRAIDVDLVPFALTRAAASSIDGSGTVAHIHIGATTTNILIAERGVARFVRTIGAAGDDITRALASRFEVSTEVAENMKRSRGFSAAPASTESERLAAEIINNLAGEQLTTIINTLQYFATQRRRAAIDTVVLSGGGSALPGFAEALGHACRLPIVTARPFEGVAVAKSKAMPSELSPSLMTAYGLALGAAA